MVICMVCRYDITDDKLNHRPTCIVLAKQEAAFRELVREVNRRALSS